MTEPRPRGTPGRAGMGERLRSARQARALSLRDLAHRLGVSPSMISQIETGRANPSVSTLYSLAEELDVSLDVLLFDDRRARGLDERQGGHGALIQRSDSRRRIRLDSGVVWERLTPFAEPDVEFLHVIYEVGGASSPETAFQRHPGHEWGYVLQGQLEVRIGFEEYLLGPGDSVSFASTVPHRLANVGEEAVHAIWFVLGRIPTGGAATSDLHVATEVARRRTGTETASA